MHNKIHAAPCPFCGSAYPVISVGDDDSFYKTIYISCIQCGCMLQSSIDYKPYCSAQPGWAENRKDFEDRYREAYRLKIIAKWNRRCDVL